MRYLGSCSQAKANLAWNCFSLGKLLLTSTQKKQTLHNVEQFCPVIICVDRKYKILSDDGQKSQIKFLVQMVSYFCL